MIEWLADNWAILVAFICVAIGCFCTIKHFVGLPSDEQIKSIKEWLLYAVTEAEKELGGGTGKLKLRQVYDMFVGKFSWVAKVVSFEMFSLWVDEALIEMRKLLDTNTNIREYVDPSQRWEEK